MKIYTLKDTNVDLEELKQHCNSLYSTVNQNEVSSWNYNELNLYFKNLVSIFQDHFDLDEKKFFLRKLRIEKNSKKIYDDKKLPYIPHIDFNRCLKFMIYLNDVDQNNGSIHISNVDPETYEKKRLNLKPNTPSINNNHITDLEKDSYLPMIGKAGDIIFFDTNQPHFGGSYSSKDLNRFILRIDFINSDWKYPYMKKENLFRKIIRNLLRLNSYH
tara:strand:- start:33 stop:680 length:648 start_codon:yes stop_codon:yes gene_type:complete